MITVGELTDWILKNRSGTAFKGLTKEQIVNELTLCIDNKSLVCVSGKEGIYGVLCFERNGEDKTLYVYNILTVRRGIVKHMAKFVRDNFPGFIVTGHNRHERFRNFKDINKLTRRL